MVRLIAVSGVPIIDFQTTLLNDMDQNLLFICTGNYYRSRFAEMLFNARASGLDLHWRAVSRGLELGIYNTGPIYPLVLKKLERLGISVDARIRAPIQLEIADLESADLVIALDEGEHGHLLRQRFAPWADRVHYWNVPDLHMMKAEDAFTRIEKDVATLIEELRNRATSSEPG